MKYSFVSLIRQASSLGERFVCSKVSQTTCSLPSSGILFQKVLGDYYRFIIAWKLCTTMAAQDVQTVLDDAITKTGVDQKPRLLSDNVPCFVAKPLQNYLEQKGMRHTRGTPYHPMPQGRIERYHRTMKNVVKLQNYFFPWELEKELETFVDHYNHRRYHESLNNVTPADVFHRRQREILTAREIIKQKTLEARRIPNQIKVA